MKRLFTEPSHRRDEWLFRLVFGTLFFFGLLLSHARSTPWPSLAFMIPFGFLAGGIAELLPRSWVLAAGILRGIWLLCMAFLAIRGLIAVISGSMGLW